MFVVFIITWLMYGSSRYLIYSKSKNGKLPQKFGRYQRNVVTFYQTVLLNSVQEMFFAFLAFWPSFKIKPENVQIYTLIILLIYGLVLDFLMPIILISKLKTRIPALFIEEVESNVPKWKKFYVNQPDLVPRRDEANVKRKKRSMSISSVIIKVEEALPTVVA